METKLTDSDLDYLYSCLELAKEAVEAGDKPFGSILVDEDGEVLARARNRVNELTPLAHPEFELAQWAALNLTPEKRKKVTMYTTGEHCPMCATAHGWVGLGTIVYATSARQLQDWLKELGVPPSPVSFFPVQDIIPGIQVKGPASGDLAEQIKSLHQKYYSKQPKKS